MTVTNEQLAEFIEERTLVGIRRDCIDSRLLQAIPIRYSSSLLLVQYIFDFHVDGQLVLRREDITSISCRATDRFQRRLLEENGLIETVDFDFRADLSSYASVLNSQPAQSIVILENEGLDDSAFWIGRFVEANDETIRLHEFSGAANWESELTEIDEKEITCCQLNSNYIRFYARYFESHPPPGIPE